LKSGNSIAKCKIIEAGTILRIQANSPFPLHWTNDDWQLATDTPSKLRLWELNDPTRIHGAVAVVALLLVAITLPRLSLVGMVQREKYSPFG
jgi:hypothetical protein